MHPQPWDAALERKNKGTPGNVVRLITVDTPMGDGDKPGKIQPMMSGTPRRRPFE